MKAQAKYIFGISLSIILTFDVVAQNLYELKDSLQTNLNAFDYIDIQYSCSESNLYYLIKTHSDSGTLLKRSFLNHRKIDTVAQISQIETNYLKKIKVLSKYLIAIYANSVDIYTEQGNLFHFSKKLRMRANDAFLLNGRYLVLSKLFNNSVLDQAPLLYLYSYDLKKNKHIAQTQRYFSGIQYTQIQPSSFISANNQFVFTIEPLRYQINTYNYKLQLVDSIQFNLSCTNCDSVNRVLDAKIKYEIALHDSLKKMGKSYEEIKEVFSANNFLSAKNSISELNHLDSVVSRRIQKIIVLDSTAIISFSNKHIEKTASNIDYISLFDKHKLINNLVYNHKSGSLKEFDINTKYNYTFLFSTCNQFLKIGQSYYLAYPTRSVIFSTASTKYNENEFNQLYSKELQTMDNDPKVNFFIYKFNPDASL